MRLAERIAQLESAENLERLQAIMQETVEAFGFCAYNFFDAGRPHSDKPLFFGTTGANWEAEYKSNEFVRHDHTLAKARKTNLGFKWSEVPLPLKNGIKRPVAMQLMDAAQDHGFKDGYILPFHFVDFQGRTYSTLSALFWSEDRSELARMLNTQQKAELNLILLYWTQRVVTLLSAENRNRSVFGETPEDVMALTDREREVLEWASRGKTMAETSELLDISLETVKTHTQRCIKKLNALNRIHAVTKAYKMGAIDF